MIKYGHHFSLKKKSTLETFLGKMGSRKMEIVNNKKMASFKNKLDKETKIR